MTLEYNSMMKEGVGYSPTKIIGTSIGSEIRAQKLALSNVPPF
jgi:hypothetical protein